MTKPKYQIGDCLSETNIFIRGIANLSNGKQRYFLQAGDNTFVFEADEIENLITLAKYFDCWWFRSVSFVPVAVDILPTRNQAQSTKNQNRSVFGTSYGYRKSDG